MANREKVSLVFSGSDLSETEDHTLECYCNSKGELYLSIEYNDEFSLIVLDLDTAKEFLKHIIKEIKFMEGGKNDWKKIIHNIYRLIKMSW